MANTDHLAVHDTRQIAAGASITYAATGSPTVTLTRGNLTQYTLVNIGSVPLHYGVNSTDVTAGTAFSVLLPGARVDRDTDLPQLLVYNPSGTTAGAFSLDGVMDGKGGGGSTAAIGTSGTGSDITDAQASVAAVPSGQVSAGLASTDNSTTTPLAESATYTGTWESGILGYGEIKITPTIAPSNATGTLHVDFSTDGVTTERTVSIAYDPSVVTEPHTLTPLADYVRLRYVNDAVAQTTFRLGTAYGSGNGLVSRLNQTIGNSTDVRNVRAVIAAADDGNSYSNVTADERGALRVALASPMTVFGELRTASPTPIVQMDAIYGLPPTSETFIGTDLGLSGTAGAAGGEFVVTSGTNANGYGVVRARRPVRYRPGQGIVIRITGLFDTPQADSLQFAGAFNVLDAVGFGYNGTSFGVARRKGGAVEVQTLTISAAATGGETATITVNGTAHNVSITSGSVAHNAWEIAEDSTWDNSGWNVSQVGSTLVFQAESDGDKTNTFSVSSDGTFAGSFAETTAGASNTWNWTAQASWSIDPMDGSGPSGLTLDPAAYSVFEICIPYLGAGPIVWQVLSPTTGAWVAVHREPYPNNETAASLMQPSLKPGWFVANEGNTTDLTVKGICCAGFVDGVIVPLRDPAAEANTKTGISTTLTNIISFRVSTVFQGVVNLQELRPLIMSVAGDGTKPVLCEVWKSATLGGEPNWVYHDDGNSIIEEDTAGTTISGGTFLAAVTAGGGQSGTIDLERLGIVVDRGEWITIAAAVQSGSNQAITVTSTWREE